MADLSYQQARRLGLKEAKARSARHEQPCLAVLEEELPHLSSLRETDLGVCRIDLEQVAGTRSAARREAFSASFYPLLEENSEFAGKWSALAASHLKEGIRDPILAVEYLNRYYVVEGHKRVSVLRFFGAATVRAEIRRILPAPGDTPEILAYGEYLDFYRRTRANYVVFREPGLYPALLELLCGADERPWDEERQRSFFSDVSRLRSAFRASGLGAVLTQDEALLCYLRTFGLERLQTRTPSELKADLAAIAPELLGSGTGAAPRLLTDPEPQKRDLLHRFTHPVARTLRAAFLYENEDAPSPWTREHEEGRLAAEAALGGRAETRSVFGLGTAQVAAAVEALAGEGFGLILSTSPRLLAPTLTAAAAHPEIPFLCCSLSLDHPLLRGYCARTYEANFLTGAVAGALCPDGRLRLFGTRPDPRLPLAANAFALGAQTVNPRCRVLLSPAPAPEEGAEGVFAELGGEPEGVERGIRVLRREGGALRELAAPLRDWGLFYREILGSVLDGSWDDRSGESAAGHSLHYWWGLSAGAVGLRLDSALPDGTRRLAALLRERVADGSLQPFEGPVRDRDGFLRAAPGECPDPEELLRMDWLAEPIEIETEY